MRPPDSVWQGCFGYWQNQFVQQNILSIGYTAWNGYLNAGRGMVICNVVDAISSHMDWEIDAVTFERVFIPQVQVDAYLQVLELQTKVVTALLTAIDTYDPTQAIVLLVTGNRAVDINLLQNLKISPADCYAQVQQRWSEFQLEHPTSRRTL